MRGHDQCRSRAASEVRLIPADEIHGFVDEVLLAPERTLPVVAVTTRGSRTLVDADRLAARLGEHAVVVRLETGPATFALAEALTDMLTVYGGACRVWWPGLTRESDPYAHPLIFVRPDGGGATERRILALVAGHEGERPPQLDRVASTAEPSPAAPSAPVLEVGDEVEGRVVNILPAGVVVDVGGTPAFAHVAYLARGRVAHPSEVVRLGQRVRARVGNLAADGKAQLDFTAFQGDPWMELADQVRPGDVVRGRVERVVAAGWLVAVLPGATGLLPQRGVPAGTAPSVGQVLVVRLVDLDPERGVATLSLRDAPATDEGAAAVRVLPGGPVFLAPDSEAADEAASEVERLQGAIDRLSVELEDARAEVDAMRDERRSLVDELHRRRRADRTRDRQPQPVATTSQGARSDDDWRAAIMAAYGRLYTTGDQLRYPPAALRIGPRFSESAAALQGIDSDRIADACAHVVANRAHEIAGLRVHQLRTGEGGAPQRERADGAKGWRLALQVGTPSARRLHYWVVPSAGRRIIEFDTVGVHDEGL